MSADLIKERERRSFDNRGDLLFMLDEFLRMKLLNDIENRMACKVLSVNRSTRVVVVEPLPKKITQNQGQVDRRQIECTTFQFAANGFVIDLPIRVGDVGWVCSADVQTSKVKDSHRKEELAKDIPHRFEYGFFIPDYWGVLGAAEGAPQNPYEGEDNRLVISTWDGKQKVSIGRASKEGEDPATTGDIRIISQTDEQHKTTILIKNGVITVDTTGDVGVSVGGNADISVAGKTSVHCPEVAIDGISGGDAACSIKGTLTVTGDITSTEGDVIPSSGFTLNKHKHTGDGGPAVGPTSKPDGNA